MVTRQATISLERTEELLAARWDERSQRELPYEFAKPCVSRRAAKGALLGVALGAGIWGLIVTVVIGIVKR